MFEDMQPYLFKTADGGMSWRKITDGLPPYAFIWVVREDQRNASVLYLGTEVGLYVSFDAGTHWVPFDLKNLPNVAVRDIFIQKDQNDILLGTHGRGLWVFDDTTPVQQLAAAVKQPAFLFPIRQAPRYNVRATRAGGGDTEFAAPNPPYGAILNYYLREPANEIRFQVTDLSGKTIRTLGGTIPGGPGIHRIAWDLRASGPGGSQGEGRGGGGRGGGARGPQVLPGVYAIRMIAGVVTQEQKVEVALDPEIKVGREELVAQWNTLQKILSIMQGTSNMIRETDRHDGSDWQELHNILARPRTLSASETGRVYRSNFNRSIT